MATLLHISDVHFGWPSVPEAVEAIHASRAALAPDLVVCSGDLVQRGDFTSQYRAARAFLDRFPEPVLSVPGNHDLVFWNPWVRLRRPFVNYRRWISPDLEPLWRDEQVCVLGIATPRPWLVDLGFVDRRQLARVREAFADLPPQVLRVLVMHHPLVPTEFDGWFRHHVRGSRRAIEAFSRAGVDLVLCGHSHFPLCRRIVPASGARPFVMAQAGTSSSRRLRPHTGCEHNAFNVIRTDGPGRFVVEHHLLRTDGFEQVWSERYDRPR
ncbi:MAG: metallophosphoesterase [Planctomycetota bacterium]|nr:MAG: metallophosphoesterase [Planctomycetota bacterium]